MKIGNRVKIVNPNSSFCGESGRVVELARGQVDVRLDGRDDELLFYFDEVEIVEG